MTTPSTSVKRTRAPYKDRHVDPLLAAAYTYRRSIAEKLCAAGVSVAVIADAFGVSRQSIYTLLNDERWAPPPPLTLAEVDGVSVDVAAAVATSATQPDPAYPAEVAPLAEV